jgi:uncharacterized protein YbjT (DUF2867 family)
VTALRKVVVFGGTGFLGRRVAQDLLDHGIAVRVASRQRYRGSESFRNKTSELEFVQTDIGDDRSVVAAMTGTSGVVNAVSLYLEQGRQTFHSVHVEAAARVAKHARALGVERLAHVSGIGADPKSHSRYIWCRGEGEEAVCTAFGAATIIRPAVMFGPDDAFLTPLLKLLRNEGIFPMFGCGRTALQPSYVEDVAEAIARVFKARDRRGRTVLREDAAPPATETPSAVPTSTPTKISCEQSVHISVSDPSCFPSPSKRGGRLRSSRRCCLDLPLRELRSSL